MRRYGVGLFVSLGFSLLFGQTFAESFFYADFDDTIVESRQEYDGQFLAYYVLFRNEYRANTIQEVADGPKSVWVTRRDLREIRDLLAKEKHVPGSLKPYTLENGKEIIPGHYQVLFDDSFVDFRPPKKGEESPLVRQLRETLKKAKAKKYWQGPLYPIMQKILSTKEGAQGFRLLTSRGHEDWEWKEFFKKLKEKGEIKHLPDPAGFHNISKREYDSITVEFDERALKIGILERAARALSLEEGRELKEDDLRLAASGEHFESLHLLSFAEDNPYIVEAAFQKFRELAMSRRFPVKYVLINTGTEQEVIKSRRPRAIVVKNNGGWRVATAEEVTGELLKKASFKSLEKAEKEAQPKSRHCTAHLVKLEH